MEPEQEVPVITIESLSRDLAILQSQMARPAIPFDLDPHSEDALQKKILIPYTETLPAYTAQEGARVVYFDQTSYWLYIYANGGWRSQKLGITQATSFVVGDGSAISQSNGGTAAINVDTVVTHNLGTTPKLIIINAKMTANGRSGQNEQTTGTGNGFHHVGSSTLFATTIDIDQGIGTLASSNTAQRTGLSVTGRNDHDTVAVSIISVGATTYTVRSAYTNDVATVGFSCDINTVAIA